MTNELSVAYTELNSGELLDKVSFVHDLVVSFQRMQKNKVFRVFYLSGGKSIIEHGFKDGIIKETGHESFELKGAFDEVTRIKYEDVTQFIYLEKNASYNVANDIFKQEIPIKATAIYKYLRGVWDKEQLITITAKDKDYKNIRIITGKIVHLYDVGYMVIRHDDDASACTEMEFGEVMGIQERFKGEENIEFTFINSNNWREKE
ncbi:hypothetical protein BPS13_0087 [Bacillus phage BPS13]|uniref:Uncharacterized protein n=1 Tax=Bacillus phage BPS13 TaxID=1136731 RepID=J9PUG6_9CAUD|nr:hypothetical protein BPS13_0087 [Bacillus phage BPS13]AEZ50266.1 hypothetical protein BPS13_0087 [Bacillus phage BPS13]